MFAVDTMKNSFMFYGNFKKRLPLGYPRSTASGK